MRLFRIFLPFAVLYTININPLSIPYIDAAAG